MQEGSAVIGAGMRLEVREANGSSNPAASGNITHGYIEVGGHYTFKRGAKVFKSETTSFHYFSLMIPKI